VRPAAEWLSFYKPRIANLRAALDWAFSPTRDASVGVALTVAAVPLWMRLSLVDECRERVEQALAAVAHGENQGTQEEMQLNAALGASLLYAKGPSPEPARLGQGPSRSRRSLTISSASCGRFGGYGLTA
jgi:hypothetical protein